LLLEPISIDADGRVAVPTGPGLGVTLNPDTIARYRVPW
jgi:L-alanine-DL-glutamate epimerase-like enolase superfamily enzyme